MQKIPQKMQTKFAVLYNIYILISFSILPNTEDQPKISLRKFPFFSTTSVPREHVLSQWNFV